MNEMRKKRVKIIKILRISDFNNYGALSGNVE